MNIFLSELDYDMLYSIARGFSYKQIAHREGLALQTIKNRASNLLRVFGAQSMPNLIAILVASDVLRLNDLYQEIHIKIREHHCRGGDVSGVRNYSLRSVRADL